MTPREYALRALRYYLTKVRERGIEVFKTEQSVIDFHEVESDGYRNPYALEYLGNAIKIAGESKTRTAMERLARATTSSSVPTNQTFFRVLADTAASLSFTDIKKATVAGLKDTANFAQDTVKIAGGIALGGVALYVGLGLGGLFLLSLLKAK
jgi:hypothetical protein